MAHARRNGEAVGWVCVTLHSRYRFSGVATPPASTSALTNNGWYTWLVLILCSRKINKSFVGHIPNCDTRLANDIPAGPP